MKKRILIVDKSFAVGGIQTALINLVKSLKDEYDIDLLMLYDGGPLKDRMPTDVNILKPSFLLSLHGMDLKTSKKKGFFVYLLRSMLALFDRLFTNRLSIAIALLFQKPFNGYDVAIAFHHEPYYRETVAGFYRIVLKRTDAKLKLGWIHYDPTRIPYDDHINEKYMNKMDKLVCVSKGTADTFIGHHPKVKVPVDYCYNMQDVSRVKTMAEAPLDKELSKGCLNCFSACRFGEQKNIPRAVRAFAPVLKEHKDVKWYIAGDGPDMPEVKRLISEYGVEDSIVLLGSLSNPYPYFKACDLYIQPSVYEAAPMVYGEALICKIPILTTDNISAKEMVDEKYGVICENSEEGMAAAFASLMENRDIIKQLKSNLENDTPDENIGKNQFKRIIELG